MSGVRSFQDLRVYQQGYELALTVHRLTRRFPAHEQFELGQQLRRAAVSIPANIAEGFGRRDSAADFRHFCGLRWGLPTRLMQRLQ